jgi:N-succinyl-L-ornithine transcarbamylase
MKHFLSVDDTPDPWALVNEALALKRDPFSDKKLGENKVLGMVFFNSSLRTRMSTTRAAYNLGMQVMALNVSQDSWQLETEDGAIMDKGNAEHIKEAIPVMASYCDMLGVRSFPGLIDRERDYAEILLQAFAKLSGKPIINLESATLHPLQSLTDLMTIKELSTVEKPKVVLTWAPHVKALPQAVPNSFAQWMLAAGVDLTIAQPIGMELSPAFTKGAHIEWDQNKALENADFVYVKNWSSFTNYGQLGSDASWQMTKAKLDLTNNARLMHCLPVRRNVVISADALDSTHSVVQQQAHNRLFAAQAVLKTLLTSN